MPSGQRQQVEAISISTEAHRLVRRLPSTPCTRVLRKDGYFDLPPWHVAVQHAPSPVIPAPSTSQDRETSATTHRKGAVDPYSTTQAWEITLPHGRDLRRRYSGDHHD